MPSSQSYPQITAFIHTFYTLSLVAYAALCALRANQHRSFISRTEFGVHFPPSSAHHLQVRLKPHQAVMLKYYH